MKIERDKQQKTIQQLRDELELYRRKLYGRSSELIAWEIRRHKRVRCLHTIDRKQLRRPSAAVSLRGHLRPRRYAEPSQHVIWNAGEYRHARQLCGWVDEVANHVRQRAWCG
jgi:hypothetical protein